MYKTLEYCILKTDRKSVDFYWQEFISHYIALSYIRLPDFALTFEEILTKKGFLEIEGWWYNPLSEDEKKNNPYANLFDWKTNFHDHLPTEGPLVNEIWQVQRSIKQMTHWKSRLEKWGIALLLILEKFASIIKNNTLQY